MIYFDANATSRIRPEVSEGLFQLLDSGCELRNASSVHGAGRGARAAISRARRSLLRMLGGEGFSGAKVVFTSGGTEACNALLYGFLPEGLFGDVPGSHIVTSAIEHQAMLEPLASLERRGAKVTYIVPQSNGIVDVSQFVPSVTNDTLLVALMAANNVTGAFQPVSELATALRDGGFGGIIISDVTQALSKSAIMISQLFLAGVDAVALSGHKLGAPAGCGAMVFAESSERCHLFRPSLLGGPQEERYRAGTENLLGIVGLGIACDVLVARRASEIKRVAELRDKLWQIISENIPGSIRLTPYDSGDFSRALANTLAIRVPGVRGDDLVVALDLRGMCVSTGSACSSGRQTVSHVFKHLALSEHEARECIRISLDWDVNEQEVKAGGALIEEVVKQMRNQTLSGEGHRVDPLRA